MESDRIYDLIREDMARQEARQQNMEIRLSEQVSEGLKRVNETEQRLREDAAEHEKRIRQEVADHEKRLRQEIADSERRMNQSIAESNARLEKIVADSVKRSEQAEARIDANFKDLKEDTRFTKNIAIATILSMAGMVIAVAAIAISVFVSLFK